ncbi:NAD(P)/FAD-dependent oxidoreductase [Hoeflea poritis]|uniref:FAD-dependent oxidoreductase n=1 Tax=Hoeflea poritis TaxID=2993659 RepID=A0ABT4VN11_9HYPH|nr:FAD-dependent oxidoreductase [Hoeflea poritis]MDA4846107.1 FAD-dependent oxidoreductase [Hoeflea poritis]
MTHRSDNSYTVASPQLSCDLLVVGAGVVGLWIARLAKQAGLKVLVLEKQQVGAGASGGLLGALMPHMPERWNPKKQFQFEALACLGDAVRELEDETGLTCGYRRCGRLLPLVKPHHAGLAAERSLKTETVWRTSETGFSWQILDTPYGSGWPDVAAMPHGLVHETLAARISPRRYLAALRAAVGQALIEGEGFESLDAQTGTVQTSTGRTITAGHTVIAAGFESFDILAAMLSLPAPKLGTAVKGQAALLKADVDGDLPLVFVDGLYVVPHEEGTVAVGSTSEMQFEDAQHTDGQLEALVERAGELCPSLKNAPVVERWAGLRPKAIGRDPMIGALPGGADLSVATGGFKITFGIAHKMAACALEVVSRGGCDALPESFRIETHLRKAASEPG